MEVDNVFDARDVTTEDDFDEMEERMSSPHHSAQEYLRPLQETADRVSRQVEQFAEALDQYKTGSARSQETWEASFQLLHKFSEIVESRIPSTASTAPTSNNSKKNRRSLGDDSKQAQDLRLEAAIWSLSRDLLSIKTPDNLQAVNIQQNSRFAPIHRYSSCEDVWEAYIGGDVVAQEHEQILDWLVKRAREESLSIEDTIEGLYAQAGRGDGVWTAGLTYTRDAIKKRKRASKRTQPLSPNDTGLQSLHARQSDKKMLTVQLDPDAVTRERAVLELEDTAFEEASWQALWEMLRRGLTLEEVRKWWTERHETWRSAIVHSTQPRHTTGENLLWSDTMNIASNREFYTQCRKLAEQGQGLNMFETAVYGLLSGSYSASVSACNSLNDHLLCFINELHVARYMTFLSNYQQRLVDPDQISYTAPSATNERLAKFVERILKDTSTKSEAHDPQKYLQCHVIAQQLPQLLIRTGRAAAYLAHLTGDSKSLYAVCEEVPTEQDQRIAQDESTIRTLAHLQLALHPLGLFDQEIKQDAVTMDNNLVNYISVLERSAKFDLLPLYASKLSADRAPHVLGRILARLADSDERRVQVRLLKKYGLAVHKVIYNICEHAQESWLARAQQVEPDAAPIKITENSNRVVRICSGFIGEELNTDEADLVSAHEWVGYIDAKHWGMAVWLITNLYKTLLLRGKIGAAKALSEAAGLAEVSKNVVGINMSVATAMPEIVGETAEIDGEDDVDELNGLASPSKRRRGTNHTGHPLQRQGRSRAELADQSVVWAHLEHLVRAIEAIEIWQLCADQIEGIHRSDAKQMKDFKKRLRKALQALHDEVQPLLLPDFLVTANDEDERVVLHTLRTHYLPECVLAYNSALYFAGHCLSRGHLVQCMELAQTVAQNESLTQAFVDSKRMHELVTCFAQDSQALIRSNEVGGGRHGQRSGASTERRDHSEIWHVDWIRDTPAAKSSR